MLCHQLTTVVEINLYVGNTKSIQIKLEQNNAYGVIMIQVPSLVEENEQCPAYGVL